MWREPRRTDCAVTAYTWTDVGESKRLVVRFDAETTVGMYAGVPRSGFRSIRRADGEGREFDYALADVLASCGWWRVDWPLRERYKQRTCPSCSYSKAEQELIAPRIVRCRLCQEGTPLREAFCWYCEERTPHLQRSDGTPLDCWACSRRWGETDARR